MKTELERYLQKSKDTIDDFHNDPGVFTDLKEDSIDWLDYHVYDNIFWLRTIHANSGSKKETLRLWAKIKDFAKSLGCNKIQFTTRRKGEIWERLLKDVKVVQWKLEVKL